MSSVPTGATRVQGHLCQAQIPGLPTLRGQRGYRPRLDWARVSTRLARTYTADDTPRCSLWDSGRRSPRGRTLRIWPEATGPPESFLDPRHREPDGRTWDGVSACRARRGALQPRTGHAGLSGA